MWGEESHLRGSADLRAYPEAWPHHSSPVVQTPLTGRAPLKLVIPGQQEKEADEMVACKGLLQRRLLDVPHMQSV